MSASEIYPGRPGSGKQVHRWSRLGAAVAALTALAIAAGLGHWEGLWKFAELAAASMALAACLLRSRRGAGGILAALSVVGYLCTRAFYGPYTQGPGLDLLALLINFVTLCACLALAAPPAATRTNRT